VLTSRHIGSYHLAYEISWDLFFVVGHKRSDKRSATICASQKVVVLPLGSFITPPRGYYVPNTAAVRGGSRLVLAMGSVL
jgi:hypothetical protein